MHSYLFSAIIVIQAVLTSIYPEIVKGLAGTTMSGCDNVVLSKKGSIKHIYHL